MKVRVDAEMCVSCGACVDEYPELFEMPGEVAVAKTEVVPEDMHDKCLEAVEICPVEAIIVEQ
jgi:ferredoxin